MVSVVQRIRTINQPRGGYLNIKSFSTINYDDGQKLHDTENIHSSIVGLAVDYLTRFMTTCDKHNAFRISIMGAKRINREKDAIAYLNGIERLDDRSIILACKLAGFDVCIRSGKERYVEIGVADLNTIHNIRVMVLRAMNIVYESGDLVEVGPIFPLGYTEIVDSGDADFLTTEALIDIKTSKKEPNKNDTLQILMYYILGKNSLMCDRYINIKNLVIANPRLNEKYYIKTDYINANIINDVEKEVIGYHENL